METYYVKKNTSKKLNTQVVNLNSIKTSKRYADIEDKVYQNLDDQDDIQTATTRIPVALKDKDFILTFQPALQAVRYLQQGARELLDIILIVYQQDMTCFDDCTFRFNYRHAKGAGYTRSRATYHRAHKNLKEANFISSYQHELGWIHLNHTYYFKGDRQKYLKQQRKDKLILIESPDNNVKTSL